MRPQPPRSSAPRAASADARRSVRKVSHAVRPRGHNRRVLPHPAPRRQTRAGRFGRFPTPCAHAFTAAMGFRARRFAASQSAGAPRRQTRAGRFERFPTPCAHAATAAVVTRVTRPRGTSRRDLPRPALRRVPIRGSAAPPDARRSVRRVYHAARLCGHSRRVLPHPAPRRQTRAGQFGRFPTPCAHAATTAAFFRTPRRVGRRAPVASEGFPRRAPTRSQPLWVSAPALRRVPIRESAASADARRSVQKVSHAVRPRVHSRRGFPRHAPVRHQPP